jgi:PKD repeat protein
VVPGGFLRSVRHGCSSSAHLLGAVLAGGLLAGCGGGDLVLPSNGGAAAIQVVEGNGQRGTVGELLASPIVVRVTDAAGDPVPGAAVEFALTSAGDGAEIVPATVTTDSQGLAEAHVLLGAKLGLQIGEARLSVAGQNPPKASFTAVAMSGAGGNQPPAAAFDWQCDHLACTFTDASTDADGSVTGWSWQFGDGGSSIERSPAHGYSTPGTYTVSLTATDDEGAATQASRQITVTAPAAQNQPPRAEFEVDCQQLTCVFSDRSSDEDGGVVAWAWDFGDGSTSTDRNPSHAYAAGGTFQVRLTVTDGGGAQDTKVHDAHPEAPPPVSNEPPHADFDMHCEKLACSFTDKSKDDDGAIVSWAWTFGDGGTSIEANPEHTYAERGHYEVVLTVTDDLGATASKTRTADAKQ